MINNNKVLMSYKLTNIKHFSLGHYLCPTLYKSSCEGQNATFENFNFPGEAKNYFFPNPSNFRISGLEYFKPVHFLDM